MLGIQSSATSGKVHMQTARSLWNSLETIYLSNLIFKLYDYIHMCWHTTSICIVTMSLKTQGCLNEVSFNLAHEVCFAQFRYYLEAWHFFGLYHFAKVLATFLHTPPFPSKSDQCLCDNPFSELGTDYCKQTQLFQIFK